ncbi:hypothetical protein EDB83DRAFT_232183 [Lactarius deliciosus]|nr:hypothetical protein EDB83DRAFT_232183 [Lactarius deliciosus]
MSVCLLKKAGAKCFATRCNHSSSMMQREICSYWLKGKCTFGKKCKNSHETFSESAIGDASPSATATVTVRIPSTQGICPNFIKGTCKFGDRCRMSHRLATETQSKQNFVEISKLMLLDHDCSASESTFCCAKAMQILPKRKVQQGRRLSFRPHRFELELVHVEFRYPL